MFDEEPGSNSDDLDSFLENTDTDNSGCDCGPEYKDTIQETKSGGASFGGFGANAGTGEAVIVCKKCDSKYKPEDESATDDSLFI